MARQAGGSAFDAPADVVEQVVLEAKYSGYIHRQAEQVERFQRMESRPIPAHFDFAAVPQHRAECQGKFGAIRPANLGQAGRISGISPADLCGVNAFIWNENRGNIQRISARPER